jgi:predicted MFS family arabinose efflux permease
VAPGRRLELLGSSAFWSVAAPFAFGLLAQVGFITHQVAFLEPRLGASGAGLALALTTVAAVTGRFALGFVVDRLDPRAITVVCLATQAAALLAMTTVQTAPVLYAASVVFGLSVGNLITLPALVVQREFPARDFVVTVALIAATSQIFYAFGPGMLGVVREAAGDYSVSLALCITFQLTGAAILLARHHAPSPRPRANE